MSNKTKQDNIDRVWGIERNTDSSAYGLLVSPAVYVFTEPQRKASLRSMARRKLTPQQVQLAGVLKHTQQVEVLEAQVVDGFAWVKIHAKNADISRRSRLGRRKIQIDKKLRGKGDVTGWVRSTLLLKLGDISYA